MALNSSVCRGNRFLRFRGNLAKLLALLHAFVLSGSLALEFTISAPCGGAWVQSQVCEHPSPFRFASQAGGAALSCLVPAQPAIANHMEVVACATTMTCPGDRRLPPIGIDYRPPSCQFVRLRRPMSPERVFPIQMIALNSAVCRGNLFRRFPPHLAKLLALHRPGAFQGQFFVTIGLGHFKEN